MKHDVLLLLDMQNDFIHANGALGRAGLSLVNNRAVLENLIKVTDSFRDKGHLIVSGQFTLIANKDNKPIIEDRQKQDWPFLARGDFQMGRWGHQLIDELGPADYSVNRIFSSAFDMTHLEWLLRKFDVERIFFAGLNIHNSLIDTIAGAQQRGFDCQLLSNGWNTFDDSISSEDFLHQIPVEKLSCQELLKKLQPI
jgi:ureidoacrylate peracid hydrolase